MGMHIEVFKGLGSGTEPRRYGERHVRCYKCRGFVDTWSDDGYHTDDTGVVLRFWHDCCWFGVDVSTLAELYT